MNAQPITWAEMRTVYDFYDDGYEVPEDLDRSRTWHPRCGLTYSEIAKELGVSRQCVQITEQRALRKIRKALGIDLPTPASS